MTDILSPRAIAKLLNVHPQVVGNWVADGYLASSFSPSGRYRIERGELDRFVEECGYTWDRVQAGESVEIPPRVRGYTITEVAELLKVTYDAVRRWCELGKLTCVSTRSTRKVRIPRESLEQFLEARDFSLVEVESGEADLPSTGVSHAWDVPVPPLQRDQWDLVTLNLNLARGAARYAIRIAPRYREDLEGTAILTLVHCACKWDHRIGPFRNYVLRSCRKASMKELRRLLGMHPYHKHTVKVSFGYDEHAERMLYAS